MKTGYQIYRKNREERTYKSAGLLNWFSVEEDAIKRCDDLNRTWNSYGIEYIVVECDG